MYDLFVNDRFKVLGCLSWESSKAWFGLVAILGLIGAESQAQNTNPTTQSLPIELQPYEVMVSVSFEARPLLSSRFRNRVLKDVGGMSDRCVGQMWNLVSQENRWLSPAGEAGLQRLSAGDAKQRFGETLFDKVYFVTVELSGAKYRISGCEWDHATERLGPRLSREFFERRSIANEVFLLLEELFAPIVTIREADSQSVSVNVKGGEYRPVAAMGSSSFAVSAGDILRPYFRYLDRDRVVRRIQPLPWTYLRVQNIERAFAVCDLNTGLRAPLSGRSRRGVEMLAIGVRPHWQSTQIELVSRAQTRNKLVGFRVTVNSIRPTGEIDPMGQQPRPTPLSFLSDRWGAVDIPVDKEHPLIWLSIRSGKSRLAEVPLVPGVESHLSIDLPDDSLRLSVEGKLARLRGDLIDTVARRSMYISLAYKLSKQEKWPRVGQLIEQLEELPAFPAFETRLNGIRIHAFNEAVKRQDRLAQGKINRMCGELLEVLQRYFDDTKIKDLKVEMQELQRLDQDDQDILDRTPALGS